MLNELIQRIPESELQWIAERDYGSDVEEHLKALKHLLYANDVAAASSYDWSPWEVIELTAYHLQVGHEEAFALCVLLVIRAICDGTNKWMELEDFFVTCSADVDKLPPTLRDAVLAAFVEAESTKRET
jgi:hypothetical protein